MLQVILALGFSAAPLTLCLPPCRQLTALVDKVEEVRGDASEYIRHGYPRFWNAWRRVFFRCAFFFGYRPTRPRQ
ncbi:hypothetical protein SUGI_0054170 [Cryptomeria japonica]|nr:hypothetical protein SUGI_0054170 [Cryptomeria japonica]